MMSTLETGYFIWNLSAWLKISLFSAGVFCLLTFIIKKKTGGSLVSSRTARKCITNHEDNFFQQNASLFRNRIMQPWFDLPFLHILSITVLFLLFIVALFSKNGVE
ncbi:MAG: hypothetical protein PHO18_03015 [Synergistaceae bacterium]|nr:hypothetical protein [Synergistaceae bacterium]